VAVDQAHGNPRLIDNLMSDALAIGEQQDKNALTLMSYLLPQTTRILDKVCYFQCTRLWETAALSHKGNFPTWNKPADIVPSYRRHPAVISDTALSVLKSLRVHPAVTSAVNSPFDTIIAHITTHRFLLSRKTLISSKIIYPE
jgi:hypothetical protein